MTTTARVAKSSGFCNGAHDEVNGNGTDGHSLSYDLRGRSPSEKAPMAAAWLSNGATLSRPTDRQAAKIFGVSEPTLRAAKRGKQKVTPQRNELERVIARYGVAAAWDVIAGMIA